MGTGTQNVNEVVKVVWGGVANGTGVQIWTRPGGGEGFAAAATLTAMLAAGGNPDKTLYDVAEVELALAVNVDTGAASMYATLFDDAGAVLGGVRPAPTDGFVTSVPQILPQPMLDSIASGSTQAGVTSNDYLALDSFEATWDSLTLTSPQVAVVDAGPDAFNGTVFGDFSDDGTAPTDLGVLVSGDNTLVARQVGDDDGLLGRDRDFFTFEVAEGEVLSALTLEGFVNEDQFDSFGFIGIAAGTSISIDGTSPSNLIGGLIFGGESDLLTPLSKGDPIEQDGVITDFPGFETPLPAGQYTIWLNQGADLPTTVTLKLTTGAAAVDLVLSIADAPTEAEAGDEGSTALAFALTLDDASFSGDLTVTYDAADATGLTQVVTFVDGAGTLSVDVLNDDELNGDDVSVTVTEAAGDGADVVIGTGTATGTVTDDDAASVLYPGAVVAAFNAGGPTITADGIEFTGASAAPFTGGQVFDGVGMNGPQPVFDGTVYESELFANVAGTGNSVDFSLSEGIEQGKQYFVDLYFAEIFANNIGDREFDIVVEGGATPVRDNLDILSETGGDINKPLILRLADPISPGGNGAIDLSFVNQVDRGKINAIVVREVLPVGANIVSIADATANEADGTLDVVISRVGETTDAVTVTLAATDGTALAGDDFGTVPGSVAIPAGQSSVTVQIPLPDDDVTEADKSFSLTISDAVSDGPTTVTIEDAAAIASILDDDLAPGKAPNADLDRDGIANAVDDDIDGDGTLNADDTFSYDGGTPEGQALLNGESVTFDFETDGTPLEAGFTGALLSPNKPIEEINLDNANVSGGTLNIAVTKGDNNNSTNTQENAFVAGFRANEGLSVETRFDLPDYNPNTDGVQTPVNFQASGVTVGVDQDSFVKAVFGRAGGGFEIKSDNGGGNAIEVKTAALPFTLAEFDALSIRMEVEPTGDPATSGWVARAFATFFEKGVSRRNFDDGSGRSGRSPMRNADGRRQWHRGGELLHGGRRNGRAATRTSTARSSASLQSGDDRRALA